MQLAGAADGPCPRRARPARDHRRRHLGRHGRRGDRGLCRARPHRHLHPVPARPRLAGAAAADDDLERRERACAGDRGQFRRLPGPGEGHVQRPRASATACRCPASTRSTGRASWRRSSTISRRRSRSAAPDRPVSFTVPTGNFGDIFAGYAAKRMGLPIDRLVIATNDNDILARTLASGRIPHARRRRHDLAVDGHPGVVQFRAPAVRGRRPRCADGAPLHGRPEAVRRLHDRARRRLPRIRAEFDAGRATMDETAETIRATLKRSGYLLDPHTATAVHVADAAWLRRQRR